MGVKSVSGTDFRHLNRQGAPTQDKEAVTNSPDPPPKVHVFGLCENMPGENLHGHMENIHTQKPPRG